jgi:sec-independent protein translocase protein TatA
LTVKINWGDKIYMNTIFAFLPNIGSTELFIILAIIVLLFGAKKLPELARGLGKASSEFKKASRDVEENFREAMNEEEEDRPRKKAKRPENDFEDEGKE